MDEKEAKAARKIAEVIHRIMMNNATVNSALDLPNIFPDFKKQVFESHISGESAAVKVLSHVTVGGLKEETLGGIAKVLAEQAAINAETVISAAVVVLAHSTVDGAFTAAYIGERIVRFRYKDKKLLRPVYMECSLEEFVDRWGQHTLERYQNAVRSFGLFAPRALAKTSAAIFAILGQQRRPRPKPRRWAHSIMQDFGRDPLLDATGKRMKWVRRVGAEAI